MKISLEILYFNTTSSYNIRIQDDKVVLYFYLISDINDIPEFANYQLDSKIGVEENIAIGTTIFTYSTTDLDIRNSDTVTYGWSSTPSPGSTYFSLDSSSMFIAICFYHIGNVLMFNIFGKLKEFVSVN